jgi:hypothetical protein
VNARVTRKRKHKNPPTAKEVMANSGVLGYITPTPARPLEGGGDALTTVDPP